MFEAHLVALEVMVAKLEAAGDNGKTMDKEKDALLVSLYTGYRVETDRK